MERLAPSSIGHVDCKIVLEIKPEKQMRLLVGAAVGRVRRFREHHEARRNLGGPRGEYDTSKVAGAGASTEQEMWDGEADGHREVPESGRHAHEGNVAHHGGEVGRGVEV